MIDPRLQARFASSCADAAFGYARAATAAYALAADQTVAFWRDAIDRAATGRARPERETATPTFWGMRPDDLARLNPWLGGSPRPPHEMAFAHMRAWWGLFPLEGAPSSWPMAYAMMQAGVPRSVALPASQANIAAMEAAEAAREQLGEVFSSYRTESGYAVAQVVLPAKLMTALLIAPLGVAAGLPWLNGAAASGQF